MVYRLKERPPEDPSRKAAESIEPALKSLGVGLVELTVGRHRGSTQVRVTVNRETPLGTEELGRIHRTVLPRLELLFGDEDLSVELSSPGIDRNIKEGAEFAHFTGCNIRCYLPEKSDWVSGILKEQDEQKIVLENEGIMTELTYDKIAKAKLDRR
jgi:ribosome maturation factor RimP